MTNSRLFNSKLALFGETQNDIAKLLGLSTTQVSRKINNLAEFTQGEIKQLILHWNLTEAESYAVFFCEC